MKKLNDMQRFNNLAIKILVIIIMVTSISILEAGRSRCCYASGRCRPRGGFGLGFYAPVAPIIGFGCYNPYYPPFNPMFYGPPIAPYPFYGPPVYARPGFSFGFNVGL